MDGIELNLFRSCRAMHMFPIFHLDEKCISFSCALRSLSANRKPQEKGARRNSLMNCITKDGGDFMAEARTYDCQICSALLERKSAL